MEEQMYQCDICLEEAIEVGDFILCSRFHGHCRNCVKSYAEILIAQGYTRVACLNAKCKGFVPDRELRNILDERFNKLQKKMRQQDLVWNNPDKENLVCPFCESVEFVVMGADVAQCKKFDCQKQFCLLCGKESHVCQTCEQANSTVDQFVSIRQSEAVIRHCPQCRLPVIKDDGCNWMICSQCNTNFCYACEANLDKDLNHFSKGNSVCNQDADEYEMHTARANAAEVQARKEFTDAIEAKEYINRKQKQLPPALLTTATTETATADMSTPTTPQPMSLIPICRHNSNATTPTPRPRPMTPPPRETPRHLTPLPPSFNQTLSRMSSV